jgi:hypothetical protein
VRLAGTHSLTVPPQVGVVCFTLDRMRTWTILFTTGMMLLADAAAGLKWTAPAGWKNEGSRPMRVATYTVGPASGDSESAECGVYFFGPGQGGTVEANLDRWKAQITGANGKPADAQIQKRTIHGLNVTVIDASGAYSGMGGPMAQPQAAKAGYRLLGAIVEGPGGNIFVKFAGPSKTIAANKLKFEAMLNSFEKEK